MSASNVHRSGPQPPLLAGLRADDLLRRAVRSTGSERNAWEPPAVEELAALLPQFQIESVVGRGGMGAVYRAWQPGVERPVAIKLLAPSLADDDLFRDRFRREARMLGRLHHPGIVEVHDTGQTVEGQLYYVMELVEGTDLARRMESGRVPWPEAVDILRQMSDALEHAHAAGIIHRDVKPSNVLVTESGQVKIADFGLAAPREPGLSLALTLTGTALGTVEYAAPEQMEGRPVDHRADIFSLGVIGYELLTGSRPRGAFDPPSLKNPELDPAFDGVILRALQNEPARRFASAKEFSTAMLNAADRHVQQENREREWRRKVRRRACAAGFFLVIALLTAGSAIYAWRAKHEANQRRVAAEAAEGETEGVIQFLLTDLRQRLERTGNLEAMESVLERAVAHFRKKFENSGRAPDAAVQLADALVVKGEVLAARGLGEEGLVLFEEALALAASARAAEPQSTPRRLRLVQALRHCSEQHFRMGHHSQALDFARRMLHEAKAIPGPTARRDEAAAHRAAAIPLKWLERLDECREEYLTAQRILTALAAASPDDTATASDLAGLDMSLGNLAQKQCNFPLMLKHYQAWYDSVEKTEGTDSHLFSESAVRLGHAFVFNRRPAEALAVLGDAVRIATRESEAQPGHKGALDHLYWCLRVSAEAHTMLGNDAEAKVFAAKVAQVETALNAPAQPPPTVPPALELEQWQQQEAERFTTLLATPENDAAQEAWALASANVGKALASVHGLEAAAEYYSKRLDTLDPFLKAAAPESWWTVGAGALLERLAEVRERSGEMTQAEILYRRSLELRLRLAAAHPRPADRRELYNAVSSAIHLARILLDQQRPMDAAAVWIPLMEQFKPLPVNTFTEWRSYLANAALETIAALPPAEAARLAAAVRDFLVAPGENAMSSAEMASQASVERAASKAAAAR